MSSVLTRACPVFGCPHPARACPQHGMQAATRTFDLRRGTASSRGYGAAWRAFTLTYRQTLISLDVPRAGLCGARHPSAPLTTDSQCARDQTFTHGRVVDHIVPVSGPDDPRFYDVSNLQLLCDGAHGGRGCHDRKRQREGRDARREQ